MEHPNAQMISAMADIEKIIAAGETKWEAAPCDGATMFQCHQDGWHIVVVGFSIEDQGFPPGSIGHDGAATNKSKGLVLHLTRGQAKAFYEQATGDRDA